MRWHNVERLELEVHDDDHVKVDVFLKRASQGPFRPGAAADQLFVTILDTLLQLSFVFFQSPFHTSLQLCLVGLSERQALVESQANAPVGIRLLAFLFSQKLKFCRRGILRRQHGIELLHCPCERLAGFLVVCKVRSRNERPGRFVFAEFLDFLKEILALFHLECVEVFFSSIIRLLSLGSIGGLPGLRCALSDSWGVYELD